MHEGNFRKDSIINNLSQKCVWFLSRSLRVHNIGKNYILESFPNALNDLLVKLMLHFRDHGTLDSITYACCSIILPVEALA